MLWDEIHILKDSCYCSIHNHCTLRTLKHRRDAKAPVHSQILFYTLKYWSRKTLGQMLSSHLSFHSLSCQWRHSWVKRGKKKRRTWSYNGLGWQKEKKKYTEMPFRFQTEGRQALHRLQSSFTTLLCNVRFFTFQTWFEKHEIAQGFPGLLRGSRVLKVQGSHNMIKTTINTSIFMSTNDLIIETCWKSYRPIWRFGLHL